MPISFIFSYNVINEAISTRTTSFAYECKKAVDTSSEIFQEYDSCYLYVSTQVFDAIKKGITPDQQTRFEEAIKKDSTTQGVLGYTPQSIETLSESAKTLSFSSYVIVVSDENEKDKVYANPRIIAITPKDFLSACDDAKKFSKALSQTLKDTNYHDYLVLVLFKKDICEKLKDLIK